MKVLVLGVRGMPNVQGGVETHAEHLYGHLVELGCQVDVIVRTPFVPKGLRSLGAIRLRRIWAPRRAGLEALVHSLLGVLYAGATRPDVLHIHAVGPAIVTPLARLLGLRVVVTHHGPDYERDKWGGLARWTLRVGERFGMRHANARIVISRVIQELVAAKYAKDSVLIHNGVSHAQRRTGSEHVTRFGLEPGRYLLQVSRVVPEKRQLDLIRAWSTARVPGWKLALVGGLGADAYSTQVRSEGEAAGVVLTGFLNGEPLAQLYSHAGGFVLPSSHEGMPIALLEALSYGLPTLASDIQANLEIEQDGVSYFPVGDVAALSSGLVRLAGTVPDEQARERRAELVMRKYDWRHVAAATMMVYRDVARRHPA